MRGSIRTFAGLLIAMFGVGGVENSITNADMALACVVCAVGLALMASGVKAMKEIV